jgi:16S rRNA (uracil1498-N3)-methyltransferase
VSWSKCITESEKLCLLIGPEGDFTHEEIENSILAGFQPVHLGNSRLRTETAGIYAAASVRSYFEHALS